MSNILKKGSNDVEPDYKTVLQSYENKIKELKQQLESVVSTVENRTNNIDTKLFSVIINTVAILGIFVAIAIAGFGTVSIASNVIIDLSGNILKSTFFVVLIGLVVYNFILLLMYFIMEIVNKNLPKFSNPRFYNHSNSLRPNHIVNWWLIVFDLLLMVISITLFVFCLIIF